MKNNRRRNAGRIFAAGFGLMLLAVGAGWLGKSLGILPESFEPLKYVCPACLALFGLWIIVKQFIRRGGSHADGGEARNVQV